MFREGKIDEDTVDCPRFVAFKGASREHSSSSFNLGQLTKRIVTSHSQLRFVAVVGENDSLSFFFQAVTHRCAPAFGAFFLLVLGLKKKAPKRMVLKIDRRVGGSFFFFLLPWNCLQFVVKAKSPSHAKPCWLVAAIHPESTTNWPETKAIEHAPPFTGHEQGGRDFDFGNCIFS